MRIYGKRSICSGGRDPEKKNRFKGTVTRDFLLLVFFMNQFPPAPEYPIRTILNFFENSWRNSQVKVCHRYKRHRRQICHRYQWHRRQILPPVSLVMLILVANLPPVTTTPAENCRRYQRHRWQFATGINDTGGKFATGVNDTGGK